MANKMLIDAAHREETRVVVLRGNRIEEFDFESATRRQLRGNIYLAKVTRVEPSLQAAFVDYGGNRHGFLAFSEIHPDYYQIPVADREALLQEEAAEDIAEQASLDAADEAAMVVAPQSDEDDSADTPKSADGDGDAGDVDNDGDDTSSDEDNVDEISSEDANGDNASVESVGAEDALTEIPVRRRVRERRYKIQEVIKRRQIILVQVVKEERGTKGAALTTYMSLAGRYCVLMPNTARGGGISRKITHATDRKRLKEVANNLEVPQGIGLIIRTAGAKRTKAEIKRDFEYLMRLWESVRDLTLQSSAPCMVYEEGSLIKRSIRDLYSKDVDEVTIEGEDGYKEAKSFMRMLMPSHAKNIKLYKESQPLFMRNQIENQLDAMFQPRVTLKSGGYLIINQTEALVAVDVNSGRATREHHIEDTALNTNLEAAEEVSRQMRLRDLAGLIVIDFIDMEERRNNRSVERKLKDCLKHDRARIQVGRISHFGLLEMSRQRMRAGVVEGSTRQCPTCQGRGLVRSVESAALFVLRAIEEYLLKGKMEDLVITAAQEVSFYILNQKREHLLGIQERHKVTLHFQSRADLIETEHEIARVGENALISKSIRETVQVDSAFVPEPDMDGDDDTQKSKRRRRRRGRGRGRGRDNANNQDRTDAPATDAPLDDEVAASSQTQGDEEETDQKDGNAGRRPRRRRTPWRSRRGNDAVVDDANSDDTAQANQITPDATPGEPGDRAQTPEASSHDDTSAQADDVATSSGSRRRRSPRGRERAPASVDNEQSADNQVNADDAVKNTPEEAEVEAKPAAKRRRKSTKAQSAKAQSTKAQSTKAPSAKAQSAKASSAKAQSTKTSSAETPDAGATTDDGDGKPAPKRRGRPKKTAAKDGVADASKSNGAGDGKVAGEPAKASPPDPVAPVDTGPARSGWWRKR